MKYREVAISAIYQEPPPRGRLNTAVWFLILLAVTVSYQAIYCRAITRGDPAGLFFAGSIFQRPAEMKGFVYEGPGYDGQMYRLLAYDALDQKGYWKLLDDPRYRARRGLVPVMAALLGGGSPALVDMAFIAVIDIVLALGGVGFIRLTEDFCKPVWAASAYLLLPAVVAATDRMVLDGVLLAGFLAMLVFWRDGRTVPLMIVLVLTPWARETALCLTAGVMLAYIAARKFRQAALTLVTAAPAAGWWWFVTQRTPPSMAISALSIPLFPQLMRLFAPFDRPVAQPIRFVLASLDVMGCVCLLIALGWFIKALLDAFVARNIDPELLLVLPFGILSAFSSSRAIMEDPYAFLRVNSPLVAWALLRMLRVWHPYATALYVAAASAPLAGFRVRPIFRYFVN